MASIYKEIALDARADDVWDAIRDFGAVHRRVAPDFLLDARLDGDARIVTFSNGTVAREVLVTCDDARKRLVYDVASERVKQHSASIQIIADGEHCRMIWITDVLPNEVAPYIDGQMELGAAAIRKTFARTAA